MLYLDSSALLKLLWQEPESDAVRDHVASEDLVIVSSLAELETHVQLSAAWLAGRYGKVRLERFRDLAEKGDVGRLGQGCLRPTWPSASSSRP